MKIIHLVLITHSVLVSLFFFSKEIKAGEPTFLCSSENRGGEVTPTTYANYSDGGKPIAIIYWISNYFSNSGGTPEQRCIVASAKLQYYYDNRLLGHINTDIVNNLSVICISRTVEVRCTESDVIITLPPDVDRFDALEALTNVASLIDGEPLELNDDLFFFRNGEAYINFDIFLERARAQ